MNIEAVCALTIAAAGVAIILRARANHRRNAYPRPYIAKVESTGRWAIAIDALNGQPIFRACDYPSDRAALDIYEHCRGMIANPTGVAIALGSDGFEWTWAGWKSEQAFRSMAACRENWNDCRAAILAHDDPRIIYDVKL